MQIPELFATGGIATPWPLLVSGLPVSGSTLGESDTCVKKCGSQRLCAQTGTPGEKVCIYGMTFYKLIVGESELTVYGVRGPSNKTPLNRYTRDGLKGRTLTPEDVSSWANKVKALLSSIERDFGARQSEMLDPLHDPIRLAKQINTIANRLIQIQSRGSTLEQQIDNASVELKTLVKAADLLSDSFDLLAIYFNPAAASYGRQTAISLHGLITKLSAIFRIDDGGITRTSARIFLNGSCYRNVFVYESFKLVPFALLSNAVKYVMQGNIDVVVEDRRQHVELSVASTGPLIEEDERELIFRKRGRGKWAARLVDGKGVGLYLADLIARAHGTSISVISTRTGSFQDGIPLARNCFTVHVPVST